MLGDLDSSSGFSVKLHVDHHDDSVTSVSLETGIKNAHIRGIMRRTQIINVKYFINFEVLNKCKVLFECL